MPLPLYSWFKATANPKDTYFSSGRVLPSFDYFSPPDDSLTRMIFHVAWPSSGSRSHCKKMESKRRLMWQEEDAFFFFAEKGGFWIEEMKRLPAEHGDQSIKDQPQTVWGEGGGGGGGRKRRRRRRRDTLISVAPALTLMAASNGPVPAAGICFNWIRFFFFPFCAPREEKKINTWEHGMTGASFQNWSGCQALSFGDFCSPLYF